MELQRPSVNKAAPLPRLSAIWWGLGARLALALCLVILLWAAIFWALR
ncbi:MAG: hypothetical protein Q4E06_12230 [Lautropia sp.]|nr:hypothetical protein [Lautropia sp.]